ncbi:hypothetical protein [Actinacidiphila acididurans]|uniref:Uncharacterized protein n=1 Tax=Actinacidiphila acididurans TaxID=2784346 RepID=A0ABS2TT74_9ACTN|nr:hypothetical protein [Actinacidiphila acididurans]MBM9505460.1 hypothetical protein [Actinacidiphila acididurans]
MGSDGAELNPDDILWAPGIDYVAGWREAKNAAEALATALLTAWPDAEDVTAVAQSAADGSGLVQLHIPPSTARALAALVRGSAAGRGGQRSAS